MEFNQQPTEQAVEEAKILDETTKEAVAAVHEAPECTGKEQENCVVVDTSSGTTASPATTETTEMEAAESESGTKTIEEATDEAEAAENTREKTGRVDTDTEMPADSIVENADAQPIPDTGGLADQPESKLVEEQPAKEIHPPTNTIQELPATQEVTTVSESPMHGFTAPEEEVAEKDLESEKADVDEKATTNCAALAASTLASKVAQAEAASDATTASDDDANVTANKDNKFEELATEVIAETELISPSVVTAPIEETSVGRDVEAVKEYYSAEITQTKEMGKGKDQQPISVGFVQNVEADEPKPSEGQDALEKISDAEAVRENSNDENPSNDKTCATKMAATPEVVEHIKRRTLESLLTAEKNTEKLATGDQSTDADATPHSTTAQEVDANNSIEETPDSCKENLAANNDGFSGATITSKGAAVRDSIITEEVVKESVHEGTEAAAEDTKETKIVTERDLGLGELSNSNSNEEEKQGEVAAKPSQRHSNNIISKVKQSIVKVKKVIIGKSPSSKTMTPQVEAGDIK